MRRGAALGTTTGFVSGASGWQLLTNGPEGQIVVPDTGLRATGRGLGVMRPGGRTVKSWPWTKVSDLRVGAAVPQPGGERLRLVELHAGSSRHLFACSATELLRLRSALERHAPHLAQAIPVEDERVWIATVTGTLLRVLLLPSLLAQSLRLARPAGNPSDAQPSDVERSAERTLGLTHRLRHGATRQLSAVRNWREISMRERIAPLGAGVGALALLGGGLLAGTGAFGGTAPVASRTTSTSDGPIMSRMDHQYQAGGTLDLPAATAPPAPAPPSLAGAPALKAHEIFGFAPYWTLPDASGFDVGDLTTLAYFSVDVNADGTIDHSSPGWVGYESQDLANLITRAHQASSRVVLTATCFDQATLDSLTSSPTAASTLASSLVQLVEAKNMDGVNLDFEGQGAQDQAGLDRLVSQVSGDLHAVNPHWQVTMDTYGSSAGDPSGFYDIRGLAPSVDAFFVMAYDMDDPSTPSPTAALTGQGFSDVNALSEYTAVVPPSKVILGVPYYGYVWPTAGPAQGDPTTGPPTPVSYSQVVAGGHPVYWDPVSQTPWTSYEVGTQWYQAWFDDATSLALKAQLANSYHVAGLGVWALGMDGNDPSMMAALLGKAPVVKNFQAAPVPAGQATPANQGQPNAGPSSTSTTTGSPANPPAQNQPAPGGSGAKPGPGTPTTTTTIPGSTQTGYSYTGTWDAQSVTLDLMSAGMGIFTGTSAGQLTDFATSDPAFSCLDSGPTLPVYFAPGASDLYVVEAKTPSDCVEGTWEFVDPAQAPSGSSGHSSTSGSTTTSSTTAVGSKTSTSSTPSGSSSITRSFGVSSLRATRKATSRRLSAID